MDAYLLLWSMYSLVQELGDGWGSAPDVSNFDGTTFLEENDWRVSLSLGATGIVIECLVLPLSLKICFQVLRWISMWWTFVWRSFNPLTIWCMSAIERLCLKLLRHHARTHSVWGFVGRQRRVPSTLQWSQWCSHSLSDLCRSVLGCFFGCYRKVEGIHAPSLVNWWKSLLVDLHTKGRLLPRAIQKKLQ